MAAALSNEPSEETIPNEKEINVSGIGFATGDADKERVELAVRDAIGVAVMDNEVVAVFVVEGVELTKGVELTEGVGLKVADGDGVGDGDGDGPSCGCTALAPAAVTLLK